MEVPAPEKDFALSLYNLLLTFSYKNGQLKYADLLRILNKSIDDILLTKYNPIISPSDCLTNYSLEHYYTDAGLECELTTNIPEEVIIPVY